MTTGLHDDKDRRAAATAPSSIRTLSGQRPDDPSTVASVAPALDGHDPTSLDGVNADDSDRAAGDDGSRRVFRAAVAIASGPFVVTAAALIIGVGGDYLPYGDLAMTELHVRDVGRNEVLTGLWSRFHWNHPGPLQFYVIAPFYWLTGGSSLGLVLGALAVNLATVVGILAIARRRGGTPLVLCSLVACLLLTRSLGPEFLGDAWNLTLPVLPFLLLAFVTWSMMAGEAWALPAGAAVATFLVQTHVGYLITAAPLFACGALGLVLAARRDRGPAWWRPLGRAAAVTIGVLAVLWLPPAIDLVINTPSNASEVYRYFRDPGDAGHTIAEGWRVATGQFTLPPEWLTGKLPAGLLGESRYFYSSPLPVLLVPVAAATIVLWRRSRDARGLVVTLALMLALVVVSVMRTVGSVWDYRLRYTWVPPLVAAVVVLWATWLVVARRWPGIGRALVPAGLAVAVALAGVNAVSGVRAGTPHEDHAEAVEALSAPVIDAYDGADGRVVVIELVGVAGPTYSRALVLQLERAGIDVKVDPRIGYAFSPGRVHDGGPVAARLVVATKDDVPVLMDQPGVSLLARWSTLPPERYDRVRRQRQELLATHEAGAISDVELLERMADLDEQLLGDGTETSARDVAVFLDERTP